MTAVAEQTRTERMPRAAASAPLAWLRERGMGASILVAAISTAFGAVLLSATGYIAAMLRADPYLGDSETLAVVLDDPHGAAGRRRGLRRGDRHREHVLDGRSPGARAASR